jgi:serine/threonine protein kinase
MANNNIIHGDLKLDNILVKYINSNKNSYILKLTDYGVSNKFMLDICTKFRAKTAIGENTSPEMLISKDNYGQECDLWSLGILIHLLLTKNYPYPGNSDKEILNNIYKNGMRSIVKTGNNEFDHLLRRLLTKNPKDRLTWNEYFSHPFFTGGDYWKFYSKEKQLGKGLYYTVWKCQNINRREYRAIKIIDFKSIQSAFSKQYLRYPTEQDMKVYINHLITETENMELIGGQNEVNINTVKFYEYFITKNDFAIVMELCDTDLKKLSIAKNKTFTPEEIYGILTQLNNTFKIMAKYNLIHRDIKLENILVKYNGYSNSNPTFKLTGYELSKQILNLVEKFHGKIGAFHYMAPEILKGEPFDQKCDLWSLGVCIYLLCFKKYPFKGDNEGQVLNEINQNSPEFLLKTNNQNLNDLISRLLTKDPRKRMSWNEYFNAPFFQRNFQINNRYY